MKFSGFFRIVVFLYGFFKFKIIFCVCLCEELWDTNGINKVYFGEVRR